MWKYNGDSYDLSVWKVCKNYFKLDNPDEGDWLVMIAGSDEYHPIEHFPTADEARKYVEDKIVNDYTRLFDRVVKLEDAIRRHKEIRNRYTWRVPKYEKELWSHLNDGTN